MAVNGVDAKPEETKLEDTDGVAESLRVRPSVMFNNNNEMHPKPTPAPTIAHVYSHTHIALTHLPTRPYTSGLSSR